MIIIISYRRRMCHLTRSVLQIEMDGQCDKLAVDRRKYCQLSSTDDGLVYHTERPPFAG